MIKHGSLFFAQHYRAAIQSLNYLCNKPLATCVTSGVIAIALAIPALFWVFSDNLSRLSTDWQREGTISVYLKADLDNVAQTRILQQIEHTDGVAQATLKSPAEGLAELTSQEGMQDIMSYLPGNPLPAMITIIPKSTFNSPSMVEGLVDQLNKIDSIEQVKLDLEWIQRLDNLSNFAGHFANILFLLLACAIILIIVITLRLAVHRRHEEIQVLKLIGAKDRFILRPFLYSGIWYGIAGAIFAVFLVNVFMLSFGIAINELLSAYEIHYSLTLLSIRQILLLVIFAIIIGWLGARISVKRQLSSIEPQL